MVANESASTAGGPGRNRTSISQLRRLVLYPLSYGALMRPGHLAVIAEIIGVGFGFHRRLVRLENLILDPLLLGVGDRLLFGFEGELHLRQRVFGACPAHQRVGMVRR